MTSFYSLLTPEEKEKFDELIIHIKKLEPHLVMKEGKYIKNENALLFEEEGYSKYALTKNKLDFSIHSMVMYAFPEVAEFIKSKGEGLKIQKGCFNYESPLTVNLEVIKQLFELSAKQDFVGTMKKYK